MSDQGLIHHKCPVGQHPHSHTLHTLTLSHTFATVTSWSFWTSGGLSPLIPSPSPLALWPCTFMKLYCLLLFALSPSLSWTLGHCLHDLHGGHTLRAGVHFQCCGEDKCDDHSKEMKVPAVHAALKSLKGLVGELVGTQTPII